MEERKVLFLFSLIVELPFRLLGRWADFHWNVVSWKESYSSKFTPSSVEANYTSMKLNWKCNIFMEEYLKCVYLHGSWWWNFHANMGWKCCRYFWSCISRQRGWYRCQAICKGLAYVGACDFCSGTHSGFLWYAGCVVFRCKRHKHSTCTPKQYVAPVPLYVIIHQSGSTCNFSKNREMLKTQTLWNIILI